MVNFIGLLLFISAKAFSHDLPRCESLSFEAYPLEYARELKIDLHPEVARVRFPALSTVQYISRTKIRPCQESLLPEELSPMALFSTHEVSAFEILDRIKAIGGFAGKHWLSPKPWHQEIPELGVRPNLEMLLAVGIKSYFSGPFEMNLEQAKAERAGLIVLHLLDTKEPHPLGRLEWIYYMGLVIERFEQSQKFVSSVKQSLDSLKFLKPQHPKNFLVGHFYHGKWMTPGNDHELIQLIRIAGGQSVFSELNGRGPYSVSFEEIIKRLEQIDIWLPQASWTSLEEGLLLEGRHHFLVRRGANSSFLLKKVHRSFPFFEQGVYRPDLIVQDLHVMIVGGNPQHFFKAP